MYFLCDTKPDIAFVVKQPSRYNADLKKNYFQCAKRVVRYLKKSIKISLIFGQESIEQPP